MGSLVKKINKCCICNKNTDNIYEIKFKELIGLAAEYKQHISVCKECGFIFTSNPFSEEQLEKRYRDMSKYEYDSKEYCLNEEKTYIKRCERQYNFIDSNIIDFDSILEIGAASGYNLSLYRSNKDVLGIEPSQINCKKAKEIYEVDMFCGMFEKYIRNESHKKYDLIFLSHVLEHIVNPDNFIKRIKEINNKYIFIEVPGMDYKFMDEPFGIFCEEHVNYFTVESLTKIMKKNGYSIVDMNLIFGNNFRVPAGWPAISSLWVKDDIYELNLKFINNSINSLMNYISSSEKEFEKVKEIIDNIDDKAKTAIWGTGHHTSRLLGETSLLKKNIIKFYDSDVRKNKFKMIGRNIEKFNVEDILKGRVDTILISTYVFQEQIKDYLYNMDIKCNIITLY